jgi:hypothetical protein
MYQFILFNIACLTFNQNYQLKDEFLLIHHLKNGQIVIFNMNVVHMEFIS